MVVLCVQFSRFLSSQDKNMHRVQNIRITIPLTRIIISGFLASSFNCNIDLFSARVQQPVTGLRGHRSSKLYSRSTSHWPFQWPHSKTYMIGFFSLVYYTTGLQFQETRLFLNHDSPSPLTHDHDKSNRFINGSWKLLFFYTVTPFT